MEGSPELMADILAAAEVDAPTAPELVAYARDAAGLNPEVRARVECYLSDSGANRDRFLALAPDDWKLVGSCLCGAVRYSVKAPLDAIGHCHCRCCRKAHGAAFGSFALVALEAFSWKQGQEHLAHFGGEGDGVRTFCARCGTTLTGNGPPGRIALAVATLDVDPITRPAVHAAVRQRAPWLEFNDHIAQLQEPFLSAGGAAQAK